MSIIVRCECEKQFRAKDEHAGKRAKCPACGRVLVIPASGASPTPQPPTSRTRAAQTCVVCGEQVPADELTHQEGQNICKDCHGKARPADSRAGDCGAPIWAATEAECWVKQAGRQSADGDTDAPEEVGKAGRREDQSDSLFQFFPALARRFPTLAGVLRIAFFIFLITVVGPTVCHVFRGPRGRSRPEQAQSIQSVIGLLPADGIYTASAGSGGSYRDPIHGFFECEPPPGFKIRERRDKASLTIAAGNPRAGETIPRSWVELRRGDFYVSVIARKTFATTIEEDFEFVLKGLEDFGATIHRSRFVTVDGVKAGECLYSIRGMVVLLLKYKKNGLDHAFTVECPLGEFVGWHEELLAFLRSYTSLQPKPRGAETKPTAEAGWGPLRGPFWGETLNRMVRTADPTVLDRALGGLPQRFVRAAVRAPLRDGFGQRASKGRPPILSRTPPPKVTRGRLDLHRQPRILTGGGVAPGRRENG